MDSRNPLVNLPSFIRWAMIGLAILVLLPIEGFAFRVAAQELYSRDFQLLLESGQGEQAVQDLARIAQDLGGWGPAPGDIVVFDPFLPDCKRASTVAIDLPPSDCESPDLVDRMHRDCGRDYERQQNLVRFGAYAFADQIDAGSYIARPLDDILSVFIEEAGHSWQEYCHETEGRCEGERTQLTTWGEGDLRASGWEYQVKMYILSLDGDLLTLSEVERAELVSAICEGYANPSFSVVTTNPPPGWANPEGWPTVAPTPEELGEFCMNGGLADAGG